ncbi:GIY-YIG nuclease family protein [Candidatus Dojkabacteria bacterium]|jgi:hypothetical protein|nr:GIY-YIG nuclease family protein [Candidatus Dojkabacteria bacterium]
MTGENKKFVIYYFYDEKNNPFYVGKTCNIQRRRWSHKTNINNNNQTYKYKKARKILKNNPNLDFYKDMFRVVETNITTDKINSKEIEHIKKLKDEGFILTNLTNGGENNYIEDSIKSMSEKISSLHKGRKRSPEVCKKISESNKKPKSEEHKKNLKKAWIKRKKNPISDSTKKKMSDTSTGKINIKKYKIIDPTGKEYITTNGLSCFCKEHNLTQSLMIKVANRTRNHHKNWKCERI